VPKFGHSAVERNRLKRRIREIIRLRMLQQLPKIDVVIRAYPNAYNVQGSVLTSELEQSIRAIQQLFS
jgi:ribonuclease P protein component